MPALVVASAFLAGALAVGGVSPGGRVRPEEAGRNQKPRALRPRPPRPKTPRDGPYSRDYDPLDAASDLELFAACVESGLSPRTAVAAVAEASPAWADAAALLGVGVPLEAAWSALSAQPHLEELARLARLSGESGAAMATGCHRLVAQLRAEASAQATAKAERAGVFIAAPLAVCFLPAFLVLGLVPVIISLGQQLL